MLALQFLNGPQKGQIKELRPGMIFGRSQGDLVLRDKKASAQHAEIQASPEGLVLHDLLSQNGIWIGKERKKSILLTLGLEFKVAQTKFRVVAGDRPQIPKSIRLIGEEVKKREHLSVPPIAPVHPFVPLVTLKFLQGPHAGEEMVLGFGPRRVGSQVLDVCLMDPTVPALAFEIRQTRIGIQVLAFDPSVQVLVNGVLTSQAQVQPGDCVQVGKTIIEFQLGEL